ncbi:MAG: hypothetical protein ABIH39_06200 [Candidatus Margulisiibacteriota bacterium]
MRIEISKYLDIPFKHNGSDFSGVDCLGMIRLFFMTEFSFNIPGCEYDEDWNKLGYNLIEEGYRAICKKVLSPVRYGIVGFRMPGYSVEHHLGIVLYDFDQFLHSPLNKPSCVSKLSHPVWRRSINAFYEVKR